MMSFSLNLNPSISNPLVKKVQVKELSGLLGVCGQLAPSNSPPPTQFFIINLFCICIPIHLRLCSHLLGQIILDL